MTITPGRKVNNGNCNGLRSVDNRIQAPRLKIGVGPTPTDTQLLLVLMESSNTSQEVSIKAALVDAFSAALAARREVTVEYDSSNQVTLLEMVRS